MKKIIIILTIIWLAITVINQEKERRANENLKKIEFVTKWMTHCIEEFQKAEKKLQNDTINKKN